MAKKHKCTDCGNFSNEGDECNECGSLCFTLEEFNQ